MSSNSNSKIELDPEIALLFKQNEKNDLVRILASRACLNRFNISLIYLFHILQSAGIFVTTLATGYNNIQLIWIGIGLNVLASLVNILEKTNTNISQQFLQDINNIKQNLYVDEGSIVDPNVDGPEPKQTTLAKFASEQNDLL